MRGPRPVALDHNFPEPILKPIERFIGDIRFHWIRNLARPEGETTFPDLEDHELIYELHRVGFPILVTGNYKMTRDIRVVVAIEQTRMSLLTAKGVGDDAILATGVLLRDLLPLIRNNRPQGLIFEARPAKVRPLRSRKLLEEMAPGSGLSAAEAERVYGRRFNQRSQFPQADPRRLV